MHMNDYLQNDHMINFSVFIATLPTRVDTKFGKIVGTGVIVSKDGKIATCAHVLKLAVGSMRSQSSSELSLQDIKEKGYRVKIGLFPEGKKREWRQAVLKSYLNDFEDDIVLLQLDDNLPLPQCYTAFLGKVDTNHRNKFCSFGYRLYQGDPSIEGGHIFGYILGSVPLSSRKNLSHEPIQLCSNGITPGMSGAPVLDLTQHSVVALITNAYHDPERPSDSDLALAVDAQILAGEPFNLMVCDERQSLHDNPLPVWSVPPPNPFFTGRDEVLRDLHNQLQHNRISAVSQPQALSGLGGIGKTQIALAYAYRFFQDYQAVFWVLADKRESLINGYKNIAELLSLPQKDEQDQAVILKAVKAWLQTNASWLLILDNVDDMKLAYQFLPSLTNGHILLTTRIADVTSLNLGLSHSMEVRALSPEQGTLLLLRRAKLLSPDDPLEKADQRDRNAARQLSEELGGLPLALNQAGAYIASAQTSLAKYLEMYHQSHANLLKECRDVAYAKSVATTWKISFKHIEAKNHAATNLLQLCAYLAPDAIPEEILTQGAEYLGPVLGPIVADPRQLDNAIEVVRTYSLLNRDPRTHTLSEHRLVQVVLQDAMSTEMKKQWKQRAVLAVQAASPDIRQWDACGRWLPHALVCAKWIKEPEWIPSKESADLLYHAGKCLCQRAQYAEAEPLHMHALSLRESILGSEHQDVATSLSALAMLYHELGRYDGKVLEMAQRALSIREKVFGKESLEVADSLDSLGLLHKALGYYEKAWPLCQHAHSIREHKLGKESLEVATSMNNLAMLHKTLGRYEEARLLLEQAYQLKKEKIEEGKLSPDDPSLATSMNNLAMLYHELGRYDSEVLKLCENALSIRKAKLASEHLLVRSLANLAELYRARGCYEKASQWSQEAFSVCEQKLDDTYPDKAHGLNTQAMLYYDQGDYEKALPWCEQALHICEKTIRSEHPDLAVSMNNLAMLYKAVGKTEKALSLSQDALILKKKLLAPWYPHPSLARSLNNLAMLYYNQGRYEEALPLCEQAHILFDLVFGPEHPDVATSLNNLAMLYHSQGYYEEALPLYQRARSIREKVFGPEHPDVATSLNNLAMLYYSQGHCEEALPLYQRALAICKQRLGETHPHTKAIQQNYDKIQQYKH